MVYTKKENVERMRHNSNLTSMQQKQLRTMSTKLKEATMRVEFLQDEVTNLKRKIHELKENGAREIEKERSSLELEYRNSLNKARKTAKKPYCA